MRREELEEPFYHHEPPPPPPYAPRQAPTEITRFHDNSVEKVLIITHVTINFSQHVTEKMERLFSGSQDLE